MASTLKLHRNGAVGFIDWLDVSVKNPLRCAENKEKEQHEKSCKRAVESHQKAEYARLLCLIGLTLIKPIQVWKIRPVPHERDWVAMAFENELGPIPQSSRDDHNGKEEQTKHLTRQK